MLIDLNRDLREIPQITQHQGEILLLAVATASEALAHAEQFPTARVRAPGTRHHRSATALLDPFQQDGDLPARAQDVEKVLRVSALTRSRCRPLPDCPRPLPTRLGS